MEGGGGNMALEFAAKQSAAYVILHCTSISFKIKPRETSPYISYRILKVKMQKQ
jgi:hypothetical protein